MKYDSINVIYNPQGVRSFKIPSKCDRIIVKHFNDLCAMNNGGSAAFRDVCFGFRDELDLLVTVGGNAVPYRWDAMKVPPYCEENWVHRCLIEKRWYEREPAPGPVVSMSVLFSLMPAENDSIGHNLTDVAPILPNIPSNEIVIGEEDDEEEDESL